MHWTWGRVRAVVAELELATDGYVVGLAGAMLANESVDSSEEVVLLVTDRVFVELDQRGWRHDHDLGGLRCPTEPGLFARAGDVSDTYTATIPELIDDAWRQDGIPVVSVLQIVPASVRRFLDGADGSSEPAESMNPSSMAWSWARLRVTLPRLDLSDDDYVVGLAGTLLANDSLAQVEAIELLVTDRLRGRLEARGWFAGDGDATLLCPFEDNLSARTGALAEAYTAPIADLIAEAWRQDGLPCVSMLQVREDAVRSAISAGLS